MLSAPSKNYSTCCTEGLTVRQLTENPKREAAIYAPAPGPKEPNPKRESTIQGAFLMQHGSWNDLFRRIRVFHLSDYPCITPVCKEQVK